MLAIDGNAALFWKRDRKNWRYFRFSLIYSIKEGRRRRSRKNVYLLQIEAKSFRDARQDIVRIQKVIWDHLLAFKGEIMQKQAFLFSLPFRFDSIRTPNNTRVVLIYAVCSVFFFRSLFYLAEVIFWSKSRKESLELMFSFKV